VLIRHASTAAVRRAAFPVDEPLDDAGRAAAALLAGRLGRGEALCSPALRARETAAALGLDARVDSALDECAFGVWAGRTLAEVHAEDPEGAGAWMTDAQACPHGGESLCDLLARVGRWLDGQALEGGRAIAVTHAGVVKAAVVHALGAPAAAFWQVDVAPLSIAELHAHDGRWTLTRLGAVPPERFVDDMDVERALAGVERPPVAERGRVCDDIDEESAQVAR
jgi:broad specificity phosphatase PhoE